MEPGLRDREYWSRVVCVRTPPWLQWSPVLETGNTPLPLRHTHTHARLQWSPVLETGNTALSPDRMTAF